MNKEEFDNIMLEDWEDGQSMTADYIKLANYTDCEYDIIRVFDCKDDFEITYTMAYSDSVDYNFKSYKDCIDF